MRENPLEELSDDELLVFFEWVHRFCETGKLAFAHHAEVVVLDSIAGRLERSLSASFRADYSGLLNNARQRILSDYEIKMSKDSWIHQQPLDQV